MAHPSHFWHDARQFDVVFPKFRYSCGSQGLTAPLMRRNDASKIAKLLKNLDILSVEPEQWDRRSMTKLIMAPVPFVLCRSAFAVVNSCSSDRQIV